MEKHVDKWVDISRDPLRGGESELTCLRGILVLFAGVSTVFSSCRRASTLRSPAEFGQTWNSSSQMSLTLSCRVLDPFSVAHG